MPSLMDYLRPQPRPGPFDPFNSRVTYYAPGPGDRMEGGFETSRPNPQTGKRVPATLDDVRLGTSPFVTLAGDPSRYGQTVKMGPLTYTSPIDQKSYTLPDVTGHVHDTGSAFKGRPDKLDVAAGDYRGYSPQAASAAVQADAGRRTVTPLEGDEADRAMRPIGMPEPWRATGEGYDQTAVAEGPPQQGRKMPNSLMDMFQPQDAAGQPTDLGGALTGRSNSLIGLGLGLLSPSNPLRGESSWSNALQGYMGGAGLDARQATAKASLAHQKTQDARQAAMDQFHRAEAVRNQANLDRTYNTPQVLGSPESGYYLYDRSRGVSPQVAGPSGAVAPGEGSGTPAAAQDTGGPIRQILPAQGKATAPAGYEWGPPGPDGRKTMVPIEGGPATKLSDTAAGHLALLQAAKPGLEEAKKYFLDPKPLLLREGGDQAGGSLYSAGKQAIGEYTGSFEIGRQRRNVRLGVEAALRAATGAAAPETEVQRYTDMYAPSIKDSYETRKQKIEALDRFISTYEGIATRGHGMPKQQTPAASGGGVRKYNPETGKIE